MAIPYSKQQIDQRAGDILRNIRDALRAAEDFELYLAGITDDELSAAGYDATGDEIANLRGAFADHGQTLPAVYKGSEALATATDFRRFSKFIAGIY